MTLPIRVAMVIGPAVNGGTEAFAMNYYKNIDHDKVEFDFLVENESKIICKSEIEKYGNGKIIIIPSYKNIKKYIHSLETVFLNNHYDIVHSNMNTLSYFTLKAAKRAGIECRIAHSHSTSNPGEILRNLIKMVLKTRSKKYATHFFSCSNLAGMWLFGKKEFIQGNITVIPNAIDLEKFRFSLEKRLRIRKQFEISKREIVIGNVGRLVKQKNPFYLLDIFFEFFKEHNNSILMLVGEGPLQEKLKKRVEAMGISKKVIFAGTHDNISDYYCAFDCFVFPSIYEGLGISLVEAQASGLSCLASTYVPRETKLTNNVLFLDLSKTPKEWANSINIISVQDRCSSKQMFVNSKFDIHCSAKMLEEKYFSILKENSNEN